MSSFKVAIAGAAAIVGTLAMIGTLVGTAPEPGPAAVPAAAPLPEQPQARVAPAQAKEARPASTTPTADIPKAVAQPAAEESKLRPASPKPAPVPMHSTGGDRDCTEFGSHEEAQRFFLENGGPSSDPHKLDRDHDGLACEGN